MHRQDESERAALAHSGFDGQAGAHFFGQFINHRKPQTRAATGRQRLGGEKRPINNFFAHKHFKNLSQYTKMYSLKYTEER